MSPDEPIKPETEERLRDAMQSYATRREPDDGWETIAGRVDRRWWQRAASPRVWGPGLVLAAAAAVLLFFVMGGEGSEQSEELEVGDPTAEENQQSIIAITADDKLVEIVPGGETREIFDLSGLWGRPGARPGGPSIANPDLMRRPAVLPDGSVLVSRQGSAGSVDCQPDGGPLDPAGAEAAQDWNGVQLWRIFTDGRTETFYGSFAPSVSPDGTEVATVQPDLCNGGFLVNIVTLDGSAPTLVIESDRTPTAVAPAALLWEGSDRVEVLIEAGEDLTRVAFDAGSLQELDRQSVKLPGSPTAAIGPSVDGGLIVAHLVASSQLFVDLLTSDGDLETLFTMPPLAEDEEWYEPLAVEASAATGDVLLTAAVNRPRILADPYSGPLFLWEGEGEPQMIADGIVAAAWGPPHAIEASTTSAPTSAGTSPDTADSNDPPSSSDVMPRIAVLADDRIVVLDGQQADLLTLLPGTSPYLGSSGIAEFAVSADARDVYLAVNNEAADPCGAELRHYRPNEDESGETFEVIASRAAYPALSPDGSKLAYVEFGGSSAEDCPQTLIVHDLETGDELGWTATAVEGFDVPDVPELEITRLRWAPDSQQLAFEGSYVEGATLVRDLWTVDTAVEDDGTPSDATPVMPESLDEPDFWSLAGWAADGDLVLASECLASCAGSVRVVVLDSASDPSLPVQPRSLLDIPANAHSVHLTPNNDIAFMQPDAGEPGGGLELSVLTLNGDTMLFNDALGAAWLGF
jgi:hypothetical protein